MSSSTTAPAGWRTPAVVIVAGCLIALVGFGGRSVFGLFLEPMTQANGWSRETFALAMAIQNLLWGIGVPIAGMVADRVGSARVIIVGTLIYALGTYGMANADSASMLHLTGGIAVGVGVAFTAFSLALAAMAKVVGPERRSLALGLGTAAGSMGQVVFSPITHGFIATLGWYPALMIIALSTLVMIPLALALPGGSVAKGEAPSNQTLGEALNEAVAHRGYLLLTLGFFVCGFHVAFITVHFPTYVQDIGLDPKVGAYAMALVGLCNIAGSLGAGAVGQKRSKATSLTTIYALRAIIITALLLAPKTETTIYLFAAAMGLLWLSTVPLTTGLVAGLFGVRFMATLFGIVFLSHQLGSFLGVWLGGYLYDRVGSYDPMWWAGVALGVLAALLHWPIDERPVPRLRAEAEAAAATA